MPGYFSFQKLITPRFVKFIYVVGLMAVTAGGIGLAIGAGLGLRSATLSTRMGVYYIAIGVGAVIIGNLVWRVLCEIWIVRGEDQVAVPVRAAGGRQRMRSDLTGSILDNGES